MSRRWVAVAVGLALLAAGCAGHVDSGALGALDELGEPSTTTTPATSTTMPSAERDCLDHGLQTKSYHPDPLPAPGAMPPGTDMAQIQRRGRLRVGVDQTTLGFGYRNRNGDIEGFDVSVAREVARAIFGDPHAVDLVPVSSAQRMKAVRSGQVDLLASLMTMTCERWQQVLFSSEYYDAGERVLVRTDSGIKTVGDLDAGRKVCATASSTSIQRIHNVAPHAQPFPVQVRADCLVYLQEGKVDAIAADDTILYGFMLQDPGTRLLEGPPLEDEPYGIAMSQAHPELVRFVNAVLDHIRADGTWMSLDKNLADQLGLPPAASPPEPQYRD